VQIALTITTARRFRYFERTIRSIAKQIKDMGLISEIIHFDDGSDQDDLLRMKAVFKKLFPEIRVRRFFDIPFPHNRHHAGIMQMWFAEISRFDYVFHCEDDWEFIDGGHLISQSIRLLEAFPEIGQVGVWRKPPDADIRTHDSITYWVFPHDPSLVFDHCWQHEDMIDPAWPNFSLRPAVMRVSAVKSTGNFGRVDNFEFSYARRWTEAGFKTAFLARKYCRHLASEWEDSAYFINRTDR